MRRFILLLSVLSLSLTGAAQDKTTLKERIDQWKNDMAEFQKRSEPKRMLQAAADTLLWQQADAAVNRKSFVIEADAITFRNGTRILVNSTTNFISVKGDRGVVQISPNSFVSGPNGVGGITVKGSVSGMDIRVDKRGVTHINMNITGIGINAGVDISLYPETNEAYVIVSPNFNSQTLRIEGVLVPYEQSRTFEGTSL